MQGMIPGLIRITTWLIVFTTLVGTVLPPMHLVCRRSEISGVMPAFSPSPEADGGCCAGERRASGGVDQDGLPGESSDDQGCTGEGACCVFARSVFAPVDLRPSDRVPAVVPMIAAIGSQTCAAEAHGVKLIRLPRA